MFCIFNYAIVFYSWFFLKETANRSLEEMEVVFGSTETAFDVEATRQKAMMDEDAGAGARSTDAMPTVGGESRDAGTKSGVVERELRMKGD